MNSLTRFTLGGALAALLVGASPSRAIYPHVDFPELVHSADVIFVGTVSGIL